MDTPSSIRIQTQRFFFCESFKNDDFFKILTSFTKNHKRINDVVFIPNTSNLTAMTASDDHLAFLFDVNNETKETKVHYTITHKKEVISLALHPLNTLVFTASKDKTWSFHDLESQTCVMINEDFLNSEFNLR